MKGTNIKQTNALLTELLLLFKKYPILCPACGGSDILELPFTGYICNNTGARPCPKFGQIFHIEYSWEE